MELIGKIGATAVSDEEREDDAKVYNPMAFQLMVNIPILPSRKIKPALLA